MINHHFLKRASCFFSNILSLIIFLLSSLILVDSIKMSENPLYFIPVSFHHFLQLIKYFVNCKCSVMSLDIKATSEDKKILESCENQYWFPQFLDEVCPLKTEYNSEWKRYLLQKNFEEIKKSVNSTKRFAFYTPKIVKSVFNVCKMFRQPPEVKYLALDVLDRFLVEHFLEVSQTYEEMAEETLGAWQAIVERILDQAPLRILTSVQLAMKYSWSCNVITAKDIQQMLKFLGHKEQYSKKSILKSETRIYKHLNYNIPKNTPFTYLEMFFDNFQRHEFFNIRLSLHHFFNKCIHVLDVAVIFHQQIYNLPPENKEKILENTPMKYCSTVSLKANFVVLAASVIFTTSILVDPSTNTSKILLGVLCSISECRKSMIEELGKQLLNIIQNI